MASLKGFFQEVMMELDGRDNLYKAVQLLSTELKAQLKKQKPCDAVYHAALQFNAQLVDAMHRYNQQTGYGLTDSPKAVEEFATICYLAIYEHQPTLMAAPGLWNQLKAHINNFLEKYRICEPLFNTVKSDLALKNDFRMRYGELKAMYASAQDEEKSCCLGL